MNAQTTSGNGKEIESSSGSQKRSKSAQPQNKSPQPLCCHTKAFMPGTGTSWKGEQKTTSKTTGSPRRLAARDDDHIGPTPSGPGGWLEEINPYLPVSFANPDEATYIRSLKETFELNYSNEKFEFAHFAFHLLYMSFATFTVWKIRVTREADFKNALIGFNRDRENCILRSDSPFSLLQNIREPNLFRFLKLIGCENAHVSRFAQFSNRRNRIVPPKGSLFINHPDSLDFHLSQIVEEVNNIQGHMQPIIHSAWGHQRDAGPSENHQCSHWEQWGGDANATAEDMKLFIQQNYLLPGDMEIICPDDQGS